MTTTLDLPEQTEDGICQLDTTDIAWVLMTLGEMIAGSPLYKYQQKIAFAIFESVLENDGEVLSLLCSRQCVGPDQIVTQRDGSLCRMVESENSWMTKRRAKTYSLQVQGGYQIDEVTKEHVFFREDGQEVALKDLSVGDRIAVITEIDQWRNQPSVTAAVPHRTKHGVEVYNVDIPWTRASATLLGYMVSDGYCALNNGQAAKFTNIDTSYLDEFKACVDQVFPDLEVNVRRKGKGWDLYPYSGTRTRKPNPFKSWLKACAFDHGFPTVIGNTNKELVGAFLRGAFHGDGHVSKDPKRGIEYACGNDLVFARYMQALLLKVGVRASVKREYMKKGTNYFYRLVIAGRNNCLKFYEVVGYLGGHKKEAHRDNVAFFKEQDRKQGKGYYLHDRFAPKAEGPHGETLTFSRINAIKPSGFSTVYDREEPNKGWFSCQGIKTHNSGKSQVVSVVCSALCIAMPLFARMFPNDPRFNLYNEDTGVYLGYKNGFRIGVFGPKKEQADIIYNRTRNFFNSESAAEVLEALELEFNVSNGRTCALNNGSEMTAHTANEGASIEGWGYHLLITDETQKIADTMIRKSIIPMGASVNASMVNIGTASTGKCYFYHAHRQNKREFALGAKKCFYEVHWTEAAKENKFYAKFVEKQKSKLGERSDEFKMSFCNEWILERGMFVSEGLLNTCMSDRELGDYSTPTDLPRKGRLACVAGIDFGKSNDRTVCSIGVVDFDNPVFEEEINNEEEWRIITYFGVDLVDFIVFEGDDYESQYLELHSRLKTLPFPLRRLGLDATGCGAPICDRFKASFSETDVIEVVFSPKSKDDIYRNLLRAIRQKHITFPSKAPCEDTDRYLAMFSQEMCDLEKTYSNGYMLVKHPDEPGAHDDFPDGIALMNYCASSAPLLGEVEFEDATVFYR